MKASFALSDKLVFEVEGKEQVDVFKQLSSLQEVFSETTCKNCGSTETRFQVRQDKEENEYYEMVCTKCHARLSFGQNKKGGTLFPKRKSKEGNWLDNNGWIKYVRPQQAQKPAENVAGLNADNSIPM
jgi:RNase P subunit RPR2